MNFKFDSFCLIKYSSLEKERKNALAIGLGIGGGRAFYIDDWGNLTD